MKKLVCSLLFLCSATVACNRENPVRSGFGDRRFIPPRLTGVERRQCCTRPPSIRDSCPEPIRTREQAQDLLVVAGGTCLDRVVAAVEKRWPEDLAAAYIVRARRNEDPVDLLRAVKIARGFNRALAQELLGLTREAIVSWDAVAAEHSDWSKEAGERKAALQQLPDPTGQWNAKALQEALQQRDRTAVTRMALAFPFNATRYFLESGLSDAEGTRLFADVLAEGGEPYPRAIVESMERTADRVTMERAMHAFREALASRTSVEAFARAASLLKRAGNPLYLYARYKVAAIQFTEPEESLPILDEVIPVTDDRYRVLSYALHALRANALEQDGRYLDAHAAYVTAFRFAEGNPTAEAGGLSRRGQNYTVIGSPDKGLSDALHALQLLPHVPDLNARNNVYGCAAEAATALGREHLPVALQYRNAAVAAAQKVILNTEGAGLAEAKKHLAIALRERAETHVARGDIPAAESDLQQAEELAEATELANVRPQLRMRVREVRGELQLSTNATAAAQSFAEAIGLATEQDSTYRAVLHFKRAEARRRAGVPGADDDVATAFAILHAEAIKLLESREPGSYEDLWTSYFSRFQELHREAIQRRMTLNQAEDAFVQDEQARAFEPLHVVLQLRSAPRDFRPIHSRAELLRHLETLPQDTAILQYLVLKDQTYVWVLTRGKIRSFRLRVTEQMIDTWRRQVLYAVEGDQRKPFDAAMRAVYTELFRTPLTASGGAKHIVIVPDATMHGLPFAGLQGTTQEGHLLRRASIATAGSTTLYLYARARDAQLASTTPPSVLLTGNPAFDPRSGLDLLDHAQAEVEELHRVAYPRATLLTGTAATMTRFLEAARGATIVHFAGHAIPSPQSPWTSRLLLAAQKNDSGELTAEKLMRKLSELERTRLVVLGACSTAGGQPVGPEGLAPLVRPLIAANVPAVVGTLWDVDDATSKDLLVSLHCHYRHGDDVAVALRAAQLERLRNNDNPLAWAPYQVVGYAGSPYAARAPLQETPDEQLCTQHSLQRTDGLHPQ